MTSKLKVIPAAGEKQNNALNATNELNEVTSVLKGWAAITCGDEAIEALGTTKGAAAAVHYSVNYVIDHINRIVLMLEHMEVQP